MYGTVISVGGCKPYTPLEPVPVWTQLDGCLTTISKTQNEKKKRANLGVPRRRDAAGTYLVQQHDHPEADVLQPLR